MPIRTFEDIEAWQEARKLNKVVHQHGTDRLIAGFMRYLRRSSMRGPKYT